MELTITLPIWCIVVLAIALGFYIIAIIADLIIRYKAEKRGDRSDG